MSTVEAQAALAIAKVIELMQADPAILGRVLRAAGPSALPPGGNTGSGYTPAFHTHADANPMTTQDDLIVGGASGVPARLAKGSDGQVLTVDPTTHHLIWATPSGGGGSSGDAARVYNSANISLTNTVETLITFDTETQDTNGLHSTVTNTGRLTCQTTGTYLVTANVRFASNAGGFRYAYVRLNGTTLLCVNISPAVNGGQTQLSLSTQYPLSATDYIELFAYQSSGGNLNVEAAGVHAPVLAMVQVA